MKPQDILHVGICRLEPVQVISRACIFGCQTSPGNYDRRIRQTFQRLRECAVDFGLDPKVLLHIGIPTLENKQLVLYECCIEFPLPIMLANGDFVLRTLPGGEYALLRLEKTRAKIGKAIRDFLSDYVPKNHLILDEERPIYEIYYEDTMEYCVPLIK